MSFIRPTLRGRLAIGTILSSQFIGAVMGYHAGEQAAEYQQTYKLKPENAWSLVTPRPQNFLEGAGYWVTYPGWQAGAAVYKLTNDR